MTETAATSVSTDTTGDLAQHPNDQASASLEKGETPKPDTGATSQSAGALLKRLREQSGCSLETLSGALKVPVKTLRALEEGDATQMPDVVFSRALAASVCRTLKVDAAPVLALMPQLVRGSDIVKSEASLNVPMGRSVDLSGPLGWLKTKSAILVAVIVVGIIVLGNWPTLASWWAKVSVKNVDPTSTQSGAAPLPTDGSVYPIQSVTVAATSSGANAAKTVVSEVLPNLGSSVAADNATPLGTAVPQQLSITVQASSPSWIEVTDSSGKTIWKRLLDHRDPVLLAAPVGSRMAVGNAAATRVTVNGKAVDLAPVTNANVARMDLQ